MTVTLHSNELPDVQSRPNKKGFPIDKVGISDLNYPIIVLDRENKKQHTIAKLALSVSLPHHFKGTHMSRFIEVLNHHRGELTMRTLPAILTEMKECLDAESAHVEVRFPYFVEKSAPVTGAKGLMDYQCFFAGESNGQYNDFILGVEVPVQSLCPCSREISDYGAHNQRGTVNIRIRSATGKDGLPSMVWIEELVEIAEKSASAPLYPLLKRADERFLTMQAYDNPAFVEDIVRNVSVHLKTDQRIEWFRVHIINHESIHNHSAFAEIEWTRNKDTT